LSAEVALPPGTQGRIFRSTFSLGTIFFGLEDAGYVFSAQRDKDLLLRIHPKGLLTFGLRSELAAGINFRGGAVVGDKLLITVDFWPGGGNRHGGLFELSPKDGKFRQWKLSRDYGGMADIVPAPKGGWYFAEFESADNVFHLAAEKTAEKPLITKGQPLPGPTWVGVDADGAVCVLNSAGAWPSGGTPGLYRISPDGEAKLAVRSPDGANFGGLAIGTGGPLGKAILLSMPGKGHVVRALPDGSITPLITGLVNPGSMRVNPASGDLWLVAGKESKELIRVYKLPAKGPSANKIDK
jgi:hypothetical protein